MKSTWAVVIAALALASSVLSGCSSTDNKAEQVVGTLGEADKAYWLKDTEKAHHWIENAVALQPDHAETYFGQDGNLGATQITSNHGDYAELIKILVPAKKIASLASEATDIDGELGDAYDRLGNHAASVAAYKDQIADIVASTTKAGAKLSATSKEPLLIIKGNAEWCSDDHIAARNDLNTVRASNPAAAADAANELAYMEALSRENLAEAESLGRFAISKVDDGDDSIDLAEYRDTLGWVLHQEGNDQAALPYLQLASNDIPEIADCTYHLAVVYESLGQAENARRAYDRVVALQPQNATALAGLARLSHLRPTS